MTLQHPIPTGALQQHIAILGKTGSGKTYAAKGVVENLLAAGERVCIIDPTGAWHGLRSSATGKSAGFPVVIFGGEHADLPLGGAHGEALAEIIGASSTPAIIDTSLMRVGERTQFFADFADALIRKNKGPLHLVIDEAHVFAPQGRVSDPKSGAMLHAANNLVSLGRSRGLRIILITQRPAKLHKDSLTQVETLVALRLIAPQDRAAVEAWIKDNADEKQGREVISSLATLKTGHGWLWAPELGLLERVTFPKIRTFDSSRAPTGDAGAGPVFAPIDRDAIAQRLQTVAKDALDNDPKTLRAEITRLKRQVSQGFDPAEAERGRRAAYDEGFAEGQRMTSEVMAEIAKEDMAPIADLMAAVMRKLRDVVLPAKAPRVPAPRPTKQLPPPTNGHTPPRATGGVLTKAQRLILTALAQYPDGRTLTQVAVLTGYAVGGGGFRNAIGSLRTAGQIAGAGDRVQITEEGLGILGDYDPLPTGERLLEHWMSQLSKAERQALRVLALAYPNPLPIEYVATSAGYEPTGGGFRNAIGRLRTLELISGPAAELRASDDLFG